MWLIKAAMSSNIDARSEIELSPAKVFCVQGTYDVNLVRTTAACPIESKHELTHYPNMV
jgi:hypothetical protein